MRHHALAGDITQVLGMDDIHRPTSVCGRAQKLAAEAYGADATYFLVNGSTSGNQAMLLAALYPGDPVLVPRNAHCSLLSALTLSGAAPIFYEPAFDEEMGVYHGPEPDLFDRYPQVRALCLTTPTYYGVGAPVHELVEAAHRRGVTVLADEAWGPHLAFHPDLPPSALAAGADLVVQSTHKLLPGLTQAAVLHRKGFRVDPVRLEQVLRMLSTTSPSCLVVASIDTARRAMALGGRERLQAALDLAREARARIDALPGLRCFGTELRGRPGVGGLDETRLVVTAGERGRTGHDVERHLRDRHGIAPEIAERHRIVFVVSPGHTRAHVERLVAALEDLPWGEHPLAPTPWHRLPPPRTRLTPRQAFEAPTEAVPLSRARGRVCAETISLYPPGIALVVPGEEITGELVERLLFEVREGGSLQGAHEARLNFIRVVREDRKEAE